MGYKNICIDCRKAFNMGTDFEKIKFALESRPKSATDDKEYFVAIDTDNIELKRIVKELTSELDNFPMRK